MNECEDVSVQLACNLLAALADSSPSRVGVVHGIGVKGKREVSVGI